MSLNKELRSLALGSAHEKFDVWTRPNIRFGTCKVPRLKQALDSIVETIWKQ